MFVLIFEMSIFYAPYMYVYIIYIHISISPCIPMIPTSDSCHAAVPTLLWQSNAFQAGTTPFPPGPRVGRSVIRSRWFHFMDSTFWKFTSNIYVWLQISYIYIYIYTLYILVSDIYIYIYISDISTCWIIVNYLSFKAGLEIPMENQCFIAGKSSNCPAMPRYEGRVGNGEDHNGSNRSKLRWQGMGRNLALKIGS